MELLGPEVKLYRTGITMMKFVTLTLSAVLLLTVMAQASRNHGCRRLGRCFPSMERYTPEPELFMSMLDHALVDQICSDLNTALTCVESVGFDACPQAEEDFEIMAAIVEYACSPEGREVLVSLAHSPCATDQLQMLRAEQATEACFREFQSNIEETIINAMATGNQEGLQESDICPFVQELQQCVVFEIGNVCGPELGQFLNTTMDLGLGTLLSNMDCHAQARRATRSVARALRHVGITGLFKGDGF